MTVPKVRALPFKDRIFTPTFAQSDICSAVIVALRLDGGRGWQLAIGAKRGSGAIVDFLVGKPARGLQKPAVTELMVMTQDDIVAVNPVMVIRRWRKVGVLVILFNRQPPWIADRYGVAVESERPELRRIGPISDIGVSLKKIGLTVVALAVGMNVTKVCPELDRALDTFKNVESRIGAITAADLLGVTGQRKVGIRPFAHIVNCWGRLRAVEKTVAATDYLNLADTLRQRRVIEGWKADPVCREWDSILQDRYEFRLLGITETAIAEIELPRCLLLADQKPRSFTENFLLIVVNNGRLLVKLDDMSSFL